MVFVFCLLLSIGFVEVLFVYGSDELKVFYLFCLIVGEWIGIMNLIELGVGLDFVVVLIIVILDGDYYCIKG